MDLQMPVMDGFTSAEAIIKHQRLYKPLPVLECSIVALTAYVNQENILKCEKSGMMEVLNKPASSARITKAIQKYCSFLN